MAGAQNTDSQSDKKAEAADMAATERFARALSLTRKYTLGTAGAGLIPFPALDIIAITAIQLKLLKDLSVIYDVAFTEQRGKALIGALTSGVGMPMLAGRAVVSVLKAIPGVGSVIAGGSMSVIAGASTYALGRVFIQHFESGGTLLNFDPRAMHEYYRKYFEEGKREQAATRPVDAPSTVAAAPAAAAAGAAAAAP